MKLLSVIVPTLDGSLPAGLPQSQDVEVIVINGISPVSRARNVGISRAHGKYVAWVDADDAVTEDWLPSILAAIEDDPDIVSFNAQVEWVDGKRKGFVVGGMANVADVLAERATGQMWNKVIRRELYEGLEFSGMIHEDYRLLCELLPRAKQIKHIERTLYIYRRRSDGLSQHGDRTGEIDSLNGLIEMCNACDLPMKREMKKGVTQRVADFCRNAESTSQFRRFMRSNLCLVLCDPKISFRVKAKVLLASIGV